MSIQLIDIIISMVRFDPIERPSVEILINNYKKSNDISNKLSSQVSQIFININIII